MQVREYPATAIAPPVLTPPPVPTGQPPHGPPRPRAPQSHLGLLVLSLTALAVGVLGMVDLAGTAVAGSAYLALPLAVVGLGLVVGAWYGRARWLIAVGLVLTVALAIAGIGERIAVRGQTATWRPTSVQQLQRVYTIDIGSAVLDLSAVDLAGRSETVRVHVGVGDLTIVVPPTVDIRAEVAVDVGNADVLGTRWGGIGSDERTVTDTGVDGPGGGDLVIRATVDVGDVEVQR